jgi:TonB family protein
MRTITALAITLLAGAVALAQVPRPGPDGIPLVNDNLSQWVIEHPGENVVVLTGTTIDVSVDAGMVHTARLGYGNFDLRFDVHNSDSSVDAFLALFGTDPSKDRVAAFAVPLLRAELAHPDTTNFPTATLNRAGVSDATNAGGDWQSYEVSRRDTSLVVRMNRHVIAQERVADAADGWIGIRANAGRIVIRDLRFESIPSPEHTPSDFPSTMARPRPENGFAVPRLRHEVKPAYTSDSMRRKIQGSVWVEVVVQTDGTVGAARLVRSVDSRYGLDEEAIKAARQWRFDPATKDGVAVPVIVSIELTFALR